MEYIIKKLFYFNSFLMNRLDSVRKLEEKIENDDDCGWGWRYGTSVEHSK